MRSFTRVDFPSPFFPTRPTRAPGWMKSETSSRTFVVPPGYAKEIFDAEIRAPGNRIGSGLGKGRLIALSISSISIASRFVNW